jgi:SEC-C motif.
MIFDKETGMQQTEKLLHLYTGLRLTLVCDEQIVLIGTIIVNRTSKGYTLYKEYPIKIIVPISSEELPRVIDAGHSIDESYPHRYIDGELCLETDTHIRIRFIDGFSLSAWVSEYVETYFFSYEYYQRYGDYPFGERGHGNIGVIQTYEELFKESDIVKVFKLMGFISSQHYRGHLLCPCGSGKKLRICHGILIMKYFENDRLNAIVRNDYQMICEEFKRYNEQQRNTK